MDATTRRVGTMLSKRKVLLVWLFDESGSMRQSQRLVRDRITKTYRELQRRAPAGGPGRIVSAVAAYGKNTHFLMQEPTTDVQKIQAAIDRVPLDTTGVENVMAACAKVVQRYRDYARSQRRVLVIFVVTDERGSDNEHLERVIAMMKAAKVRIFVLGGEAVFQKKWRCIHGKSPKANKMVLALLERGWETPFKEVLEGHNEGKSAYRLPWRTGSGFGYWALTRLAKETGGVYYVFHGEQGPTYDPAVMTSYAPELCSKEEYIRRCKADRLRGTILRLHAELQQVPLQDRIEKDDIVGSVAALTRSAERRIRRLNEIIRVLEGGTLADSPHAPKRWEANRELALADCYALRWSTEQFILTVDDFRKHGKFAIVLV